MKTRRDHTIIFRREAFTLVELLTVIVILGVMIVTFHLVFVTNWVTSLDRVTRATLWQESNAAMESLTRDGRQSRQMDVAEDADAGTKTAVILDAQSQLVATYVMDNQGKLQRSDVAGNLSILSDHVDFANSKFEKMGRTLRVNLALKDDVFSRVIHVSTSTEIFPRN